MASSCRLTSRHSQLSRCTHSFWCFLYTFSSSYYIAGFEQVWTSSTIFPALHCLYSLHYVVKHVPPFWLASFLVPKMLLLNGRHPCRRFQLLFQPSGIAASHVITGDLTCSLSDSVMASYTARYHWSLLQNKTGQSWGFIKGRITYLSLAASSITGNANIQTLIQLTVDLLWKLMEDWIPTVTDVYIHFIPSYYAVNPTLSWDHVKVEAVVSWIKAPWHS